jgi:hypothetical protein
MTDVPKILVPQESRCGTPGGTSPPWGPTDPGDPLLRNESEPRPSARISRR